jgi:hypothetical protein
MSTNPQPQRENKIAITKKTVFGVIMMRHFFLYCLIALFANSAWAEKADKDKPIEIEADTVTVNDAKKISVYTGNVIVTQGTFFMIVSFTFSHFKTSPIETLSSTVIFIFLHFDNIKFFIVHILICIIILCIYST